MNSLFFLTFILLLLRLGTVLRLLQIKEYRTDRLRDYFQSKMGKQWLATRLLEVVGAFLLFPFFFLYSTVTPGLIFIFLFLFLVPSVRYPRTLFPKPTLRSLLLGILSVSILFILSIHSSFFLFWSFFFIPFIVFCVNLLLTPFFTVIKQWTLQKAKQKIHNQTLTRIGITGNFGKSSTKEILATILQTHLKTIKTPANINTELGVAHFISRTSFSDAQVFIAEMGAYKRGEIKLLCDMVQPQIGILTGINEEHIGLFGSIENTMKAKKELLDALPPTGLAVINLDNVYCRQIKSQITHVHVRTFSALGDTQADVYATDIVAKPDGLSACIHFQGETFVVQSSLHGKHQLGNLLAAVTVALFLKLPIPQIQKGSAACQNPPHRLEYFINKKGITVIDDTYNMNPDGLKSALAYLHLFPAKKRYVVLPALIELGPEAKRIHTLAGEWLGASCDECYYISRDHLTEIHAGAGTNAEKIHAITISELHTLLPQKLQKGDVVLFCSRGAEKIVQELKSL